MLTPVNNERYISVKADGRFHEKVSKETEGAVLREYEMKDGSKGEKYELLYKDISGVFIKNIRFEDGEYGENILLTLTDGEKEVVWSESTASNFGSDLMQKLPNIDLSQRVSFKPYAFEDDRGKDKRGVTVTQADKIGNFFYDGEKNTHGFPEWSKELDKMTKTDWQIYFLNVRVFLVDYMKTNIVPRFSEEIIQGTKADEPKEEEVRPEDIPF